MNFKKEDLIEYKVKINKVLQEIHNNLMILLQDDIKYRNLKELLLRLKTVCENLNDESFNSHSAIMLDLIYTKLIEINSKIKNLLDLNLNYDIDRIVQDQTDILSKLLSDLYNLMTLANFNKTNIDNKAITIVEEIKNIKNEAEILLKETKKNLKERGFIKYSNFFHKEARHAFYRGILFFLLLIGSGIYTFLFLKNIYYNPQNQILNNLKIQQLETKLKDLNKQIKINQFNKNSIIKKINKLVHNLKSLNKSTLQIISKFAIRLLIISLLIFALFFCSKQLKINLHNYFINKQRSNTLREFSMIYNTLGTEEEKKVLVTNALQSIFAHQPTGIETNDSGNTGFILSDIINKFLTKSK